MPAKFHEITLCLGVVRTFSVLCCVKTCKKFPQNCSDVGYTKLQTSSITPETTCGGKKSLFIFKKSDADVCNYERSIRWTDTRSQHHFPLASAVHARVGLCITKAEEWETGGGVYRDNVNMIGMILVDDDSLLQWQIALVGIPQTTIKKIILSLFFSAISIRVYAYAFMRNVHTGILFALSSWFLHRWCNKLWATCCFFYFFDLWRSRLVTGLVSLPKTQPCSLS